ncbi:VOC family protein [uncultured Aquimarina sp.]|uniref:VOC family protein n=1 Tax=uncultured Aquimarina sp. TaxID=575652 RepID=UPI002626A886|nr:VOC family protein [uncultured Aquimarina sp.]
MLGLRTTIYKVSDLEKAKKWYTKAFEVAPYFDEPYYVGFNVGGFELGLQPEEETPAKKTENVLSYWGVSDVEKEFQRLIDLGAISHEKPTNVGGELMVATVKCPWDNVIGIIYNPYFKIETQ